MNVTIIIFWILFGLVFYTYLGYGIFLFIMVKIKESFIKPKLIPLPTDNELPEVTLLIAAYNEESIITGKMANCRLLDYPKDKLKIIWVTDGSDDNTNKLLCAYPEVDVLYDPVRAGKTAAINRAIQFIKTPLVIFTDANTMLNNNAIREIIKSFLDPKVGCVAGEKRISVEDKNGASSSGEGIYWRYESLLKSLDSRLYSAVGAAGELFAIRRELFEEMERDTLLDDFILSMRIAQKGYKIEYCSKAYAVETGSANITEEKKRKIRISAGGLQSVYRLRSLLNIFKTPVLSFQYISHRVFRWSVAPIALFLLLPLNIIIMCQSPGSTVYQVTLLLQLLFYFFGLLGSILANKEIKNKLLFVPYYFLFMNISVIKGFVYLMKKRKGDGTWEKAKRNAAH
ncbi:MAG: glycosyltransferase family 2 protein [Bacteroidales bacterium]